MEKITVSKTYSLKWFISGAEHYKVSPCGKVFNCQRGKEIRRVVNGGSVGYCISGKFISLPHLRKRLRIIIKSNLPF